MIEPMALLDRIWQIRLNEDYAYQADLQEVLEKVRFLVLTNNLP